MKGPVAFSQARSYISNCETDNVAFSGSGSSLSLRSMLKRLKPGKKRSSDSELLLERETSESAKQSASLLIPSHSFSTTSSSTTESVTVRVCNLQNDAETEVEDELGKRSSMNNNEIEFDVPNAPSTLCDQYNEIQGDTGSNTVATETEVEDELVKRSSMNNNEIEFDVHNAPSTLCEYNEIQGDTGSNTVATETEVEDELVKRSSMNNNEIEFDVPNAPSTLCEYNEIQGDTGPNTANTIDKSENVNTDETATEDEINAPRALDCSLGKIPAIDSESDSDASKAREHPKPGQALALAPVHEDQLQVKEQNIGGDQRSPLNISYTWLFATGIPTPRPLLLSTCAVQRNGMTCKRQGSCTKCRHKRNVKFA